jgi:RNA polymerase sigma-70 factor (ECF subfamily)
MNLNKLSDTQLLDLYHSGDKKAISTLITRHRKRVSGYIYMMVKDREIADDIFQETFIKIVRFVDEGRYTDNGKFLSWALRIAHNQVIDHFRRAKQENKITESDAGYDILGTIRFSNNTVEDRMIHEQIHQDLRKVIDTLPEEQRQVVLMRYYDNLSFKDIAEQTDVSINTALGRMRYALINLRKIIKENEMVLTV